MSDKRRIIDHQLYAHFITFSRDQRRRLLDMDHPKRLLHLNRVRAGLVEKAVDWKWSSARWYELRQSVGVPVSSID